MNNWLESEYQRLIKQGKFDNGLSFDVYLSGNDIAILNGDKIIYKKDLKHYFFEEFKIEKEETPFNIGKDFYKEWNKEDIWRK